MRQSFAKYDVGFVCCASASGRILYRTHKFHVKNLYIISAQHHVNQSVEMTVSELNKRRPQSALSPMEFGEKEVKITTIRTHATLRMTRNKIHYRKIYRFASEARK